MLLLACLPLASAYISSFYLPPEAGSPEETWSDYRASITKDDVRMQLYEQRLNDNPAADSLAERIFAIELPDLDSVAQLEGEKLILDRIIGFNLQKFKQDIKDVT